MDFHELYTNRLLLRAITPEVMDYVYNNMSDWQLMAFFGLPKEEVLKQEKQKYKDGMTTFNRSFRYFLLLDKADNKVIGWCGYHTWYPHHNRAELGYGLYTESYKRKGLMSETLHEVLRYGYATMRLHRIEAMTATYNIASIKTLQKFGFVQEATLREHYLVDGIMEDSLMFSLLNHEFTYEKS